MIIEKPMSYEDAIALIGVLRGNIEAMRTEVDRYKFLSRKAVDLKELRQHERYQEEIAALRDENAEIMRRVVRADLHNGHVGRSIARITGIAKDYDAQISDLKVQIAQLLEDADGKGK